MERTIDFLKYKRVAFAFSLLSIIILSSLTFFRGGFNYGIDFIGGHKIIASFADKNINEGDIRTVLKDFNPTIQQVGDPSKNEYIITTKLAKDEKKAADSCLDKNDLLKRTLFEKYPLMTFGKIEKTGKADSYRMTVRFNNASVNDAALKDTLKDYNASVMKSGAGAHNEYVILAEFDQKGQEEKQSAECGLEQLKLTLSSKYSAVTIESEETVGPAIGEYLRNSAWKLTILAVVIMSIYLSFRFEVKFSVGAMAALFHDIAMSLAFCGFMGIELNIQVLAALLTLYGYSVNDTIVIFDRIRETNQIKSKITFDDVINKALSQTLVRTVLTSVTTLFVVLVLFLIGGEALHDFSFVLLFGIIVGTYSSIYIASPSVLLWEKWRSR